MSPFLSRDRSAASMSRRVPDRIDEAVMALEDPASAASIDLETLWADLSPEGSLEVLSALIKADLRGRFARGERPDVAAYLGRFAALRDARERVVSLVYEEYCLLKEQDGPLDPEEFCDRYRPWRDSLLAQLECHELLSQAAGVKPAASRWPAPGDRFRSFQLREVLGQGGSARVFLANDESLGGRRVALKVSTDRGTTEASIQGRLDHKHIVPVLSVIDDYESGLRALCMPYRAGLTLDKVILRIDPASRPKRAEVLRRAVAGCDGAGAEDGSEAPGWQGFPSRGTYAEGVAWIGAVVAEALEYAHGQHVLHRDVKPANVLLTQRDGPQLLDFNLAHDPHSADRAQAALRGGTLPYMAPEQLEAFLDGDKWKAVNEAAEVYAMGLLLRELLTGLRPEPPDPKLPLPRAIRELLDRRTTEASRARTADPAVPHALRAILDRCLAPRPQDRYPTAKALSEDLRRFSEHRQRVKARVRWLALAATIAVAGPLGGTALLMMRSDATAGQPAGLVDANACIDQAFNLLRHGQWDQAAPLIQRARKLDGNLYRTYWAESFLDGKRGRPADALIHVDRAIKIAEGLDITKVRGDLVSLHMLRAAILLRLPDESNEAQRAYKRAIALSPNDSAMRSNLAAIAEADGNYEMAVKALDEAIKWGENSETPASKTTLAGYRRRRAIANVALGKELQDPKKPEEFPHAEPYFELAQRDLEQARSLAEELASATGKPRSDAESSEWACIAAAVQIGLGDIASSQGDYAASVPLFEAAKALVDGTAARTGKKSNVDGLLKEIELRLASDAPKFHALKPQQEASR